MKSWPSGLGIGGQNFGPATKAQYGQYKLLRMATQGLGQKPWFLQFLSPSKFFCIFGVYMYSCDQRILISFKKGLPTYPQNGSKDVF